MLPVTPLTERALTVQHWHPQRSDRIKTRVTPTAGSAGKEHKVWIFTNLGGFSAVCAKEFKNGHVGGAIDVDRIMVRARDLAHLEALKAKFPDQLGDCEIVETPNNDYIGRIYVDKSMWAEIMAVLVLSIDYGNFKDEVKRVNGADAYEQSLHEIWGVGYRLQQKKYGAGIYDRTGLRSRQRRIDFGDTPASTDDVVLVYDFSAGKCIGVIWWPNTFKSPSEAYSSAITLDQLELVAKPRFEVVKWSEVKEDAAAVGLPVFNPKKTAGKAHKKPR
jgi:hypothetical protein